MGTSKRDPKGDRRTGGFLQPLGVPVSSVNTPDDSGRQLGVAATFQLIGEMLFTIAELAHGYLKVKRDDLGPDIHLTYTWTLGKYAGCYVYARVPWFQMGYGLQVLERKIAAVDLGQLNPTWDSRRAKPD